MIDGFLGEDARVKVDVAAARRRSLVVVVDAEACRCVAAAALQPLGTSRCRRCRRCRRRGRRSVRLGDEPRLRRSPPYLKPQSISGRGRDAEMPPDARATVLFVKR